MVKRLRERVAEAGLTNVEAHVMDGHALELPDETFHVAVSMFGWFLFSDRARGLTEMRRVLVPGGRVLVTSWATPDRNTLLGNGMEALRAALPDLPRPPGPLPTQVPENVAAELRAAGFTAVQTEYVTRKMTFESVEEFWNLFEVGGAPIAVLRKKLGEASWQAASGRALQHLRDRFGTAPLELQAQAIFTSGTRA
jgi:SAM-dependent methyltransferase